MPYLFGILRKFLIGAEKHQTLCFSQGEGGVGALAAACNLVPAKAEQCINTWRLIQDTEPAFLLAAEVSRASADPVSLVSSQRELIWIAHLTVVSNFSMK